MACFTRSLFAWSFAVVFTSLCIFSCEKPQPTPEDPEEPDIAQTVYVGDWYKLYSFDAQTGALNWEKEIGSPFQGPTVADGVVYMGANWNLYALDATTGDTKWHVSFNPESRLISIRSIPTVANGMVYVSLEGPNKVCALDAHTGTKKWEFTVHDDYFALGAPTVVNGVLYLRSPSKLFALDAKSGNVKWEVKNLETGYGANPAVVDGVIYSISSNRLYAHDAGTGAEKWAVNTDYGALCPTVANGKVFVKGSGIMVFDTKNGRMVSKYPLSWEGSASPVAHDGVVYIGSGGVLQPDETFAYHAFDITTGTKKWMQKVAQPTIISPTVGAGIVVAGTYGILYAMDALTGTIKWEYKSSLFSRFTQACIVTRKGVVNHSSDSGDQQ